MTASGHSRCYQEPVFVVLAAYALSVAMSWPLALHPGSTVAHDLADPMLQAWQLAWGGHALLHQPLHVYDGNVFWPLHNSLAFSDSLLGYAPFGLAGAAADGLGADPVTTALVTYNLAFLTAYALAFCGGWWLGRELGASRWAAGVAGIAYAYAPWRLSQTGHLQILSSGGIALALAAFVRGYRRDDSRFVLAGWVLLTWQIAIGFGLGVMAGYLVLALAAAAITLRAVDLRRTWRATAAGIGFLVVVTALLAIPYLQVVHDHPESRRSIAQVVGYSPSPQGFLSAPSTSLVWGAVTRPLRNTLGTPTEMSLWVGLTLLVLAAIGLVARHAPRWSRVAAGCLAGASVVLAAGIKHAGPLPNWVFPYTWLYHVGPGWQGIRTPSRLITLTILALAVLAAFGTDAVRRRLAGHTRLAALAGPVLAGLVLLEGIGPPHLLHVPKDRVAIGPLASPAVVLPMNAPNERPRYEPPVMLASVDGFPKVVDGYSGFAPIEHEGLRRLLLTFPDVASIAELRRIGVHSVVLETGPAIGTEWAAIAARPSRGLRVERRPGVVVFRITG